MVADARGRGLPTLVVAGRCTPGRASRGPAAAGCDVVSLTERFGPGRATADTGGVHRRGDGGVARARRALSGARSAPGAVRPTGRRTARERRAASIGRRSMKSPGGEAGRIPALVRNRRQPTDHPRGSALRVGMPPGCLMSPARREQRHGLGHRGAFASSRCSRVEARKREGPMSITRRRSTGGRPVEARARPHRDAARPRLAPARARRPGRRGRHRGPGPGRPVGPPSVRRRRRRRRGGRRGLRRLRARLRRPGADPGGRAASPSRPRTTATTPWPPSPSQEGLAPPTYASSGLLCSINGIPASGCGQTVAGGYIYWSYFTGGPGSWTYASAGRVRHGDPGRRRGLAVPGPGYRAAERPAAADAAAVRLHLPVEPRHHDHHGADATDGRATRPAAPHRRPARRPPAGATPRPGPTGGTRAGHRRGAIDHHHVDRPAADDHDDVVGHHDSRSPTTAPTRRPRRPTIPVPADRAERPGVAPADGTPPGGAGPGPTR